ncbi:MAG: ABC transporter substrate-binding protein [Intestinibacter bartlettii]
MFKKIISIVSAAALGVCCLTGCSNEAAPEKEAKELKKITVAEVTHSVFYAPQYVAMSQGFFEEEGLEIDLVNAQGADKTMAALISGDADIGLMGPEASIYIYNQGEEDYAVNFAQLTQCDGSFLVSREKIDNFSYEDLKGKEVLGGRAGGVPLMTLEYVLKQNGVEIGEDKDKGQCNVRTDVQ